MSNPTALVQKLWNYCNPAKRDDDGLSYGDYVEQLTFLLLGSLAPARSGLHPFAAQKPFRTPPGGSSLKMADEALARGHQRPPFNPPSLGGYGGDRQAQRRAQGFRLAEPAGARGAAVERGGRVGVGGVGQPPARQQPSPKHSSKSVHGGTRMTCCCHMSASSATARPARLRQSILQKAFTGKLV